MDERRMTAWIGEAVVIKGDISADQNLTIDGRVEGTIEVAGHDLEIGPRATVKADLTGKSIMVSGIVQGTINASEKVDVRATGSVQGDIITPRLLMVEGAVVTGRVQAGSKQRS